MTPILFICLCNPKPHEPEHADWCMDCHTRPVRIESDSDGKCVACAWRGIDCDAVQGQEYCARHQE